MDVFLRLPSSPAEKVLELMERFWNGINRDTKCPMRLDDLIGILIDSIKKDSDTCQLFCEKYQMRYVADVHIHYPADKRKIARMWFRKSSEYADKKVILSAFWCLGIDAIDDLCERNNGFVLYREPNEHEKQYIAILRRIAVDLFSDLICYEHLPECQIVTNKQAPVKGLARSYKIKTVQKNAYGMTIQKDMKTIYLQSYLLTDAEFANATCVYLHELLHQFGGDQSMRFHRALLQMNRIILQNMDVLDKYKQEWSEIRCV